MLRFMYKMVCKPIQCGTIVCNNKWIFDRLTAVFSSISAVDFTKFSLGNRCSILLSYGRKKPL
jgi:hypothetical protein